MSKAIYQKTAESPRFPALRRSLQRLVVKNTHYCDAGPHSGKMFVSLEGYLPVEDYNLLMLTMRSSEGQHDA